jgi:Cupin-like domain
MSKKQRIDVIDDYVGHRISENNEPIDRIRWDSIDARQFYRDYILARKPAILQTGEAEPLPGGRLSRWRQFDYLRERAGDQLVDVEQRIASSSSSDYGLEANKIELRFDEFLNRLESGDESVYMTTQRLACDDAGCNVELFGAPLKALDDDFPTCIDLAGNLVPSQMNVWAGRCTRAGTSTGLHHDSHDNFYVLLRGAKRFTLFAPSDAQRLHTRGAVAHVHSNGLINHRGNGTRCDGVPVVVAERLALERELDVASEALEALAADAGAQTRDNAERRVDAAETALENAALDEFDAFNAQISDDDDDDESDGDEGFFSSSSSSSSTCASMKRERDGDSEEEDDDCDELPHFTTVPTDELHSNKMHEGRYASLNECKRMTVTVNVGDVLYLPASWFHEVTSMPADDSGIHFAFNLWFHPPSISGSFEAPYIDSYWGDRAADK